MARQPPPTGDLSPEIHSQLDQGVRTLSGLPFTQHAPVILSSVISGCAMAYSETEWPIDIRVLDLDTCGTLLASNPEIRGLLENSHRTGRYSEIRKLSEFHVKKDKPSAQAFPSIFSAGQREDYLHILHEAYQKPFRGNIAHDFVKFLLKTDEEVQNNKEIIYAKALSVVQTPGIGKSRTLTEAGNGIFTLPICLRHPDSPGYPPSDKEVHSYFTNLCDDNDLSITSHIAIACFLGAAHKTMLTWLQRAQTHLSAMELHDYWHHLMEQKEERNERNSFFSEVVALANSMKNNVTAKFPSPRRTKTFGVDKEDFSIQEYAKQFYDDCAKDATEDLVKFVTALTPRKPLLVTYFDEAQELNLSFWILLRLLGYQDKLISMWCVFMGTKSSISYFNPSPNDMHSLRLRQELQHLLVPYVALGFDQIIIFNNRTPVTVTMGHLQSIKHLSTYGRPMWNAQFREGHEDSVVDLAALKLTNAGPFNPKDVNHVLAVLSQRLCIDLVMASSEAIKLADRSVANHMRLLTGFSPDLKTFYTYSPSEPILALAAVDLLHNPRDSKHLGQVLNTFSNKLCDAGLVEKGLLGELGGRTLLLVARDLAAPIKRHGIGRDLLIPVLLIDLLDTLFGNKTWCNPHRAEFTSAFNSTYVNFTRWIVTRDALPEVPSQQLLGNLWARGGALQCCFNQESLDLFFVTYTGSVADTETFDVANLSAVVVQMKYKVKADTKAGPALRPLGIPRNLYRPLPYVAILLELGNESCHQKTGSQIKVTPSPPLVTGQFENLQNQWMSAVQRLREYRKMKTKKVGKDPVEVGLLKELEDRQIAMDAYNRFTISVRGASPEVYGVLKEANIVEEFATLLSVTMPSPTAQDTVIQHMRPLERLGDASAHTAWMSMYIVGDEPMHVD